MMETIGWGGLVQLGAIVGAFITVGSIIGWMAYRMGQYRTIQMQHANEIRTLWKKHEGLVSKLEAFEEKMETWVRRLERVVDRMDVVMNQPSAGPSVLDTGRHPVARVNLEAAPPAAPVVVPGADLDDAPGDGNGE